MRRFTTPVAGKPGRLTRMVIAGAALLLAAVVSAAAGAAQDATTQAEVTITGTVVDAVTGRPIPGVLVVLGGAGFRLERYIVLRGGRQAGFSSGRYQRCFPRVVLDGLVVSQGGDEPAMLDHLIDPGAVAGVEVFPTSSGVPPQYGGLGSSCGLIVIWTRR